MSHLQLFKTKVFVSLRFLQTKVLPQFPSQSPPFRVFSLPLIAAINAPFSSANYAKPHHRLNFFFFFGDSGNNILLPKFQVNYWLLRWLILGRTILLKF